MSAAPKPTVELNLGGAWMDITKYVRVSSGIQISRGRRSKSSASDAATMQITLNNGDGRFTQKKADGPYFGLINRNTPIRVTIPTVSTPYLDIPSIESYASCPDSTGLSITGDLDIRFDAWVGAWSDNATFVGKYDLTGTNRSFRFGIEKGFLQFFSSADGSTSNVVALATAPLWLPLIGRRAVRVTFDVNNGSGGSTVTFYTSDTINGTWTQVGAPIVTAGTTNIFDSAVPLTIGGIAATSYYGSTPMCVNAVRVYSGIAGTLKASPDFTTSTPDATTFTDAQGNVFSLSGAAQYLAGRRFTGLLTELPMTWDVSGRDVNVSLLASGLLRQIGQRKRVQASAYRRGCTRAGAPVQSLIGYWPMEDQAGSRSLASGLPKGPSITWSGALNLASDSTNFPCSLALPDINTASITAQVNNSLSPFSGKIQVRVLTAIPSTGTTSNAVIIRLSCGGNLPRWDLIYGAGGALAVKVFNDDGSLVNTLGPWSYGLDGDASRISISLEKIGGSVKCEVSVIQVGMSTGLYANDTVTGNFSSARQVTLNASRNMLGVTMGHLTVQNSVTNLFELNELLQAFNGESSASRFARLCAEENIPFQVVGNPSESIRMGYQPPGTVLDLLREVEATDLGILYERQDTTALAYRTRSSMCRQDAAALVMGAHAVRLGDAVSDDSTIANLVTAQRSAGSSGVFEVTTGPLSTANPPVGVGMYDQQITVNTMGDDVLTDVAAWVASIGTTEQDDYPSLVVPLTHPKMTSSVLRTQLAGIDVGDRITVGGLPKSMPPENVSQLAIGCGELITPAVWDLQFVGAPDEVYRTGVWDDSASRWDSNATTTVGSHSSSATTLVVAVADGFYWSHADGNFDLMISGERMTCTACGTGGATQNLTVTRAVNGVAKTIPAGSEVHLFSPVRYGLAVS